ncbi:hypothetical protein C0992_001256 [Termitomyces sp. T32_za158]|nr:hypothetical protein C0992_001256 [Termitomyces sp. T32_za158]
MSAEQQDAMMDDAAPEIEDPEIDDEHGFVDPNVIEPAASVRCVHLSVAYAHSSLQPAMKSHSDIPVHPPAREKILGTPFTTDSSRFEYPFPNASSDPILSSSVSPPPVPAPLPTSHSYPVNGLSSSPTAITSFSPLFSSSFPASFPTYTLTHPKLRATPPPVPPSLKKRQRWSLTLPMLRRRTSQPTENTLVPEESQISRSASIDISPPDSTQVVARNS